MLFVELCALPQYNAPAGANNSHSTNPRMLTSSLTNGELHKETGFGMDVFSGGMSRRILGLVLDSWADLELNPTSSVSEWKLRALGPECSLSFFSASYRLEYSL